MLAATGAHQERTSTGSDTGGVQTRVAPSAAAHQSGTSPTTSPPRPVQDRRRAETSTETIITAHTPAPTPTPTASGRSSEAQSTTISTFAAPGIFSTRLRDSIHLPPAIPSSKPAQQYKRSLATRAWQMAVVTIVFQLHHPSL
ncbi:hypothetical protein G7Z17_g5644 [Cylindrodendrum hubeiense]|uniref:Uncharacterized protein n=1 Tax=Cylindrodendrum hubeiense TaxID=595255 RepID=A0A9P5H8L3_9HYPO|nr:hypothetical protein G7Z17_g5644 [Cylindrodendrum hubeiense]